MSVAWTLETTALPSTLRLPVAPPASLNAGILILVWVCSPRPLRMLIWLPPGRPGIHGRASGSMSHPPRTLGTETQFPVTGVSAERAGESGAGPREE